eukprot:Nk52_evm1s1585 gene=Nk52_evmTU1s1585
MVFAHTDASQDGAIRELRETNAKGPVRSNSDPLYEAFSIFFYAQENKMCKYRVLDICKLAVGVEESCRIELEAKRCGLCKEASSNLVTFKLLSPKKLHIKGLHIPNDKVNVPSEGDSEISAYQLTAYAQLKTSEEGTADVSVFMLRERPL